jgi:hypothetical protein
MPAGGCAYSMPRFFSASVLACWCAELLGQGVRPQRAPERKAGVKAVGPVCQRTPPPGEYLVELESPVELCPPAHSPVASLVPISGSCSRRRQGTGSAVC